MQRRLDRYAPLVMLGAFAMLAISGCPGSNTAVNWPTERLDNNPTTQPAAVVVADVDADGRRDVVSLWRGETGDTSQPGVVAVHFNDAAGAWTNVIVNANTRYAKANGLSTADVNNDGRLDVLVAAHDRLTYLRAPANPRVGGDWTPFDITASINSDYQAWYDVAAMQIDGVNGLDIVATLNDVGRLVWFASPADPDTSDGWAIESIDSTTRGKADSLQLIDVNGDGVTDVVCSAPGDANGVISWYEKPADPTTPWTKHIMTSFSGATRFAFGDLDSNGTIDLAAISPTRRQGAWFPRPDDATGTWNGWVMADYTQFSDDQRVPIDIAIADMDNNGTQDVIIAASNPASLFWYSPGADNLARWEDYRIAAIANVGFGLFATDDVDGDGWNDVIVPVDQDGDNTLDRIDRFINPGG